MERKEVVIVERCDDGSGKSVVLSASVEPIALIRLQNQSGCDTPISIRISANIVGSENDTEHLLTCNAELFCCQRYGNYAASVMKGHSEQWGTVGHKMFEPGAFGKSLFSPGNVLLFSDPEAKVAKEIFMGTFDLAPLTRALFRAAENFTPDNEKVSYLAYHGDDEENRIDARWLIAFKNTALFEHAVDPIRLGPECPWVYVATPNSCGY